MKKFWCCILDKILLFWDYDSLQLSILKYKVFLSIFTKCQASSPFEAINSAHLSMCQNDVRPSVQKWWRREPKPSGSCPPPSTCGFHLWQDDASDDPGKGPCIVYWCDFHQVRKVRIVSATVVTWSCVGKKDRFLNWRFFSHSTLIKTVPKFNLCCLSFSVEYLHFIPVSKTHKETSSRRTSWSTWRMRITEPLHGRSPECTAACARGPRLTPGRGHP